MCAAPPKTWTQLNKNFPNGSTDQCAVNDTHDTRGHQHSPEVKPCDWNKKKIYTRDIISCSTHVQKNWTACVAVSCGIYPAVCAGEIN